MEIVDYELFDVPPRWKFLKLEASDGTVGWGEPTLNATDVLQKQAIEGAIRELLDEFIVGADPRRIEDHWERMYRRHFRGGPVLMTAIAGIDQALWDVKGKHYDLPVYELLGGKARDRIRLYQHVVGDSPEEMAEFSRRQVEEEGFTALKMSFRENFQQIDTPEKVDKVEDRVAAVRDAIGDDVDFGIDFHGRSRKPMANRLTSRLEPYEPMWFEEPVLPQYIPEMANINQQTSIPIATGERMWSRWDFKEAFEKDAIDVAQPDVTHAGGITELKKIGAMAEAYDIAFAPHMPYGPIALAASLQVDACTPNAFIQEQQIHREDERVFDYLGNPDVFDMDDDGFVPIPDGPGLGVEINEDVVREREPEFEHETTYWRHPDGSVADK